MKSITALFLLILAASSGFVLCSPSAESQETAVTDSDELVRKLMYERRDILKRLVEVMTIRYRQGHSTVADQLRAQHDLLDAELQLASTTAAQIQVRERQLQNLQTLETLVERQYEAGTAPIDQVLSAQAARLQANIDLLRAQASL